MGLNRIVEVFTRSRKPVPWRLITGKASDYLEAGCIPGSVVVRDPSHMRLEDVNSLWHHWEGRGNENKKLVIFVKAKEGDTGSSSRKKKSKKKVGVHFYDKDQSDEEYSSEATTASDSGLSEACPDDIPLRKRYKYLRVLSKHAEYLELVHAIRDLATMTDMKVSDC
jgi:hypothetical protein